MTEPGRITIRPARRDDVPAMAALVAEFAQYMRTLGDSTPQRLDADALERDGFGADPAFHGLVAEASGVVVGFLLHHAGYDTDAAARLVFVVDLFVTPAARGAGVGARLMRAVRDIARANGAQQLVWTIDRRNALARQFYERIGAGYVRDLELMYLDVDDASPP